ncbi:MAG: ABC transporter ATP-binding protein [Eubacteriales bacterium]|nr:ABC transporter ATP-binding protein [Eubacteriales bacterium]
MRIIRRLWQYWKKYTFVFVLYIVLGFAVSGLALLLPGISGDIIDKAVGGGRGDLLLPLIGSYLLIIIANKVIEYFRGVMLTDYAQRTLVAMRNDVFDRLMYQSTAFLHNQPSGELMTLYAGDADVCKNFMITIPTMITQAVTMIAAIGLMISVNVWMALGTIVFMPFIAYASRLYARHMRPINMLARERGSELNSVVQENIGGMRIIRSYNREAYEIGRMDRANGAYRDVMIDHITTNAKYSMVNHTSILLPQVVSFIIGAMLMLLGVDRGGISLGGYMAFWGYSSYVLSPVMAFATGYVNSYQQAIASGTKLFNFIDMGSSVTDKPDARPIREGKDHFRFEDVSLSIDGKIILDHIDLDIPRGKHIAVTGTTGCGKSMLVKMLMRFYDPISGRVTYDGTDLRDLKLADLRRRVGLVAQEAFLFSDTIENNIAYFDPDAPDEAIFRAADIAQAAEFVREMPDGFKTVVGERGVGLSGGQRQRLSIARTLLKDAPLLVLDDSTSALDMNTERELLDRVRTEMTDKSVIIIAHRVSALKDADEILFMKNGRVIERGTHAELMALNGEYATMARDQYGAMYGSEGGF